MDRDGCLAVLHLQGAEVGGQDHRPLSSSWAATPEDGPWDFGMGSFSLSPIDFEPLPNLIFNPCPPPASTYKDFPVYKTEKNPHDVADVLLSLQHAVVHPHQMPLPPVSPNYPPPGYGGQGPTMSQPNTMPPQGSSVSYSMHPSIPPQGPTGTYNQYPPCLDPPPQHHHHPQTAGAPGVFPSMSVNVSMNMTMGMPGMGYNMDQSALQHHHHHHQVLWNPSPTVPPQLQPPPSNPGYPHQTTLPPIHMSYSTSAGPQTNYPSTGSYSFTAEFRSGASGEGGLTFDRDSLSSYKNVPQSTMTSFKPVKSGSGFGFGSLAALLKRSSGGSAQPVTRQLSSSSAASPATVNGESKNNLCRICGKVYARPSTLKTHLRTHSGERPYHCNTCNKSFSQAANLTAHIRTHSGEKPFRCPICDRRFSQSSSVTTHMRTHSGERPYRCRMCKKAFSDSSTLTKHVRIHSGEKPYQCRLCLLRFSQSGNLNRHMRIHSTSRAIDKDTANMTEFEFGTHFPSSPSMHFMCNGSGGDDEDVKLATAEVSHSLSNIDT